MSMHCFSGWMSSRKLPPWQTVAEGLLSVICLTASVFMLLQMDYTLDVDLAQSFLRRHLKKDSGFQYYFWNKNSPNVKYLNF